LRGTLHRIPPAKPPRKRALKTDEDKLQIACVTWAKHQMPRLLLIHIMNNARSAARGGVAKAMGMKAGTPDILVVLEDGLVAWVEMKDGNNGRVSSDQLKMHQKLRDRGHQVFVARSFEEFRQVFVDLGLWFPRKACGDRG
jgi:hypothetical protein